MQPGQPAPMQMQQPMQQQPVQQQPVQIGLYPLGMGYREGAPWIQNPKIEIEQFPNLYVAQTKRGWCFEHFCFETESEFFIYSNNSKQQLAFSALEESSCLARMCCGVFRPFVMTIRYPDGTEPHNGTIAAKYVRPWRCGSGACCCTQEIYAHDATGPVGKAFIPSCACCPQIETTDKNGVPHYHAELECSCTVDYLFPITDMRTGQKTNGIIVKRWTNIAQEFCTDADEFECVFPSGANRIDKINLLGATFLADYNYFENAKNQNEGVGSVMI